MVGTRIAHYEITAKLGQGGMGEVYRAQDPKLDRDVAIKVLPESFAEDKERLARFEREAKVLASLNHPHIAAIHGLEESAGGKALILELVEGKTLGERIKDGALPVDEALEICRQISEALEIAHAKGVIHRDLKPGNVKVTDAGVVKVLDFGLAKPAVIEPDSVGRASSRAETAEGDGPRGRSPHQGMGQDESPTITDAFTQPGTILGTAAYMSPEQARGRMVDKRSDIWSFGCLLFECLTGARAFPGDDATDTLAGVIKGEPAWSSLPADTPPSIQLLLRKCLNKDRKRRLQDIGDARIDLEQGLSDPSSSFIRLSDEVVQSAQRRSFKGYLVAVAAALIGILTGVLVTQLNQETELPPVRRFSLELGIDGEFFPHRGTGLRLAPDGSSIVFMGTLHDAERQEHRLFVRRFDELRAESIPGSGGVTGFDISPDSRWVLIKNGGSWSKSLLISGGAPEPIGETGAFRLTRGTQWSRTNTVFVGSWGSGVFKVDAQTGERASVTEAEEGEVHTNPFLLPSGKAILYQRTIKDLAPNIMLQPLPGDSAKVLVRNAHDPRFVRSGHVLYIRDGSLYGVPFDQDTLEPEGSHFHILDGILGREDAAHYSVSDNGLMAYVSGDEVSRVPYQSRFEWVDREGNRTPLAKSEPGNYKYFQLSPDGKRIVYHVADDEDQHDIWIHEIGGAPTRLTFHSADDLWPIWNPSGKAIAFASAREGQRNLYWCYTDRTHNPELLFAGEDFEAGTWWWSPLGNHMVISKQFDVGGAYGLVALELRGDDQSGWDAGDIADVSPREGFTGWTPSFSPDGRWLAYATRETGSHQVYVQRFPDGSGRKRVSQDSSRAATYPVWSQESNELLFAVAAASNSRQYQIYTVDYQIVDGEFQIKGEPVPWDGATFVGIGACFALDPDGSRVLVRNHIERETGEQDTLNHIVLVENFFEVLRQKAASGGRGD